MEDDFDKRETQLTAVQDTYFGRYRTSKSGKKIYLSDEDRSMHMHIPGTTGSGKSNLMYHMIKEDIKAGHGLCLFEPTGNLYKDILAWLIDTGELIHNRDRYIIIDPSFSGYSFAYNPLYIPNRFTMERTELAERVNDVSFDVIKAISSVFGDDITSMPLHQRHMDMLFSLLAELGLSLQEALPILRFKESQYREFIMKSLEKSATTEVLSSLDDQRASDFNNWIMSVGNRILRLISSPMMRNMMSQNQNHIDFRAAADEGKVVLVNLSSSAPGITSDDTNLLGRMLLNNLVRVMGQRIKDDFGTKPRAFFCYIDECHRYLSKDIESALTDNRQFGMSVILANQTVGQLEEAGVGVSTAIHDCTRLKAFMGLGGDSAERYADMAFSGAYDHEWINEALKSPSVVGYREEIMIDRSETLMEGGASSWSESFGEQNATAESMMESMSMPDMPLLSGADGIPTQTTGKGKSDVSGTNSASSQSGADTWAKTTSTTERTALIPELQWLPTKTLSPEEQRIIFKNRLREMKAGQGWLLYPKSNLAFPFQADFQESPVVSDDTIAYWLNDYIVNSGFYQKNEDVVHLIAAREAMLEQWMHAGNYLNEYDLGDNAAILGAYIPGSHTSDGESFDEFGPGG